MIANFFQSLERESVAYLLISGQATVLYGAAAFSEDVDLWIEPTQANVAAFLKALKAQNARYYKLTPPLDQTYLLRGHGFHFLVPDDPEFYLDVMGCPPRVPAFAPAMAEANMIAAEWGKIPTIGIRHLVALKMTQRLGDYPVIGQLVLRYLERTAEPSEADCQWALRHVFTVEDLEELVASHPATIEAGDTPAALKRYLEALGRPNAVSVAARADVEAWLSTRMQRARRADRAYWAPVIAELRDLRIAGGLMPEGQPVAARL